MHACTLVINWYVSYFFIALAEELLIMQVNYMLRDDIQSTFDKESNTIYRHNNIILARALILLRYIILINNEILENHWFTKTCYHTCMIHFMHVETKTKQTGKKLIAAISQQLAPNAMDMHASIEFVVCMIL